MNTLTTDLTDRYIAAVVSAIPADKRGDLAEELRQSIEDAVEARIDAGEAPGAAEYAVIADLGDPVRLAAGYSGRLLGLIGPAFYLDYVRMLRLLLIIVLPFAALGVGLAGALSRDPVGEIVASTFATVLTVGVHVCFWVTLIFVIIERSGAKNIPMTKWTPEQLPQPAVRRVPIGETIASVVFLVLWILVLVWQQYQPFVVDRAGDPIPVLDPAVAGWVIPYAVALAGLEIVFEMTKYAIGRWTWPLAVVNVVLNALFAVPAVALIAAGTLVNPAFLEAVGLTDATLDAAIDGEAMGADGVMRIIGIVAIGLIVAIAAWDSVDGFLKQMRQSRTPIVRFPPTLPTLPGS